MRIGIVLATQHDRLPAGGVEKATYLLCRGLRRAGHEVTLIAFGGVAGEAWDGVPTVRVGQSGRRMLLWGARDWDRSVVEKLSELGPDVAQGEGLGLAGAAVVKWRHRARVVVAHGNTLEDLRYAYSRAGRALRAPFVRASGTRAVRGADVVVNVTRDWRVNCPVAPRNLVYIPNPIDEDFFAVRADPEPGVVAFLGGTRSIKGADLLLKAWPLVLRHMPSARLDLYGFGGEGRAALPRNCRALAAVWQSTEIAAAMGRASVVVIPSRFEVSPIVAAEAMAVGVPLVATDVGGIRAMTEGVADLRRADSDEIAAGMVEALRDPASWEARLRKGRERSVASRVDNVVASYVSLYESIV